MNSVEQNPPLNSLSNHKDLLFLNHPSLSFYLAPVIINSFLSNTVQKGLFFIQSKSIHLSA